MIVCHVYNRCGTSGARGGHNKHVLEDVQKELKLEKTILNALVPKDIVTRLLNGENQIADNFPEATVHLHFTEIVCKVIL